MGLFEGLEFLGLQGKDIEELDLYKKKDQETKGVKKEEIITSNLFDKTIKCPVCQVESKIKAIKSGALRPTTQDSDLMQRYAAVNPLFYEILYCKQCGHAGLQTTFLKVRDYEKEAIRKNISKEFKSKNYPEELTVDDAIQQHKLALLNCVVRESKASDKAILCLKLSWLYRLKEDAENERKFQQQTLIGFEEAYQKEMSNKIGGLDESSLQYLMGELNRRLGNDEQALKYFSQVITSRTASERIKDRARVQKDLIKD